jgi:lipopolysaccharide transport system permease protein
MADTRPAEGTTAMQPVIQQRYAYEISATGLRGLDVRDLWHYRPLVWLLAWRNIRVRYKQTVLGLLWALLAPVAFTAIFVVFFRLVPVQPTGELPYVPTAFAGMMLWQFFSRALTDAGTSLTSNANLITKVYFPRLVLPLSAVASGLADLVVSLAMLAALFAWYGITPPPQVVLMPLFLGLTALLVFALSLWLSAIDGLYRDLRHAVPLLLQLGMFGSPVAYTMSALVPERWRWLYEWNPIVGPLEGLRWSLIPGAAAPGIEALAKSAGLTVALLVGGFAFFAAVERTVVDRV